MTFKKFDPVKLAARPVRLPLVTEFVTPRSCHDMPDRCSGCGLLNDPCPGCSFSYLNRCAQAKTEGGVSACATCLVAAGKTTEEHGTPSVCCKSPLKDFAIEFIHEWWKAPMQHVAPRWEADRVGFIMYHRYGPVLHGDLWPAYAVRLSSLAKSKVVPREHSVVGKSGIPPEKPVVCIAIGNDPWTEGQGEIPTKENLNEMGITHWTALAWSVYFNDGRMSQFFNLSRIKRSLVVSKAHFVPIHFPYGLDEILAPWFAEQLESVPNLLVNLSQDNTNVELFKRAYGLLKRIYDLTKNKSVLVHGVEKKPIRDSFRKNFPKWHWCFMDILAARDVTDAPVV